MLLTFSMKASTNFTVIIPPISKVVPGKSVFDLQASGINITQVFHFSSNLQGLYKFFVSIP